MLKDVIGRDIQDILENPFLELVYRLEMPGNPLAAFYFTDNRPKNAARGVLVDKRTRKIVARLSKTASGSSKRVPVFKTYSFVYNLESEIHSYFFKHVCSDKDLVKALHNQNQAEIKRLDPFFYTLIDLYHRAAREEWPGGRYENWPAFRKLSADVNTSIMVNGVRRFITVRRIMEIHLPTLRVEYHGFFGRPGGRHHTFGMAILREYVINELPTVRQFLEDPRHQPLIELTYQDYDTRIPPKKP